MSDKPTTDKKVDEYQPIKLTRDRIEPPVSDELHVKLADMGRPLPARDVKIVADPRRTPAVTFVGNDREGKRIEETIMLMPEEAEEAMRMLKRLVST